MPEPASHATALRTIKTTNCPLSYSPTKIVQAARLVRWTLRVRVLVVMLWAVRLSRCAHLVRFCFIFASTVNRELRVLLDRVFWPAEGRSECKLEVVHA